MFTEYCKSCGFIPNIICKNNDALSLLSWAKAGIGIAVLPFSASLLSVDQNLVRKEIIDPSIPSRVFAAWNRDVKLSEEVRRLLDLITVPVETEGTK